MINKLAFFAVLLSPIGLALVSAYSALVNSQAIKSAPVAWILVALASAIACLNFYISFVRPARYAKRHAGPVEAMPRVSGIAVVGSIFCALALLFAWGDMWIACASLLVLLADTCGVVWLAVCLSRDKSFWSTRGGS